MLYYLYDLLTILALVVLTPLRMFRRGGFPLLRRLGVGAGEYAKRCAGKKVIWLHAVSVGEVYSATVLLDLLRKQYPGYHIVFSAITPSGFSMAKGIAKGDMQVIYFPFDIGAIMRRYFALLDPKLIVIIESEIWPHFLRQANTHAIPVVVVNARISKRALSRYIVFGMFARRILGTIKLFCVQSQKDATRLRLLGVPQEKIALTGNMKFDVVYKRKDIQPPKLEPIFKILEDFVVIIGGSTHEPEEEVLVRVYSNLYKKYPRLRLIICPRHINRIAKIEKMLAHYGFTLLRRSEIAGGFGQHEVLLLDTFGELFYLYQCASIVFIGGSLCKHGGQNPLEPASYGKAIVFGRYMFNFFDITHQLLSADAAFMISGEQELLKTVALLLEDESLRDNVGQNALGYVMDHIGASVKNIHLLEQLYTP